MGPQTTGTGLPRSLRPLCGPALALVLLLGHPAAQTAGKRPAPYALIFGTVFDAQGRTVYGVKVKMRRADRKKARWELVSDHAGEFAQRVPAGKADYVLTPEIRLPRGETVPEKSVHVDGDERVDISIKLPEGARPR